MKKYFTQKRLLIFSALMAAAVVGIFVYMGFSSLPKEEVTTYAMGSYVQQTVYGDTAADAAAQAANAVALLENQISWRKIDGDIAALNLNAGGSWQEIDSVVLEILDTALTVAKKSGGAFDPTIAPISWLWDFDEEPTAPPEKALIEQLLDTVDYRAVGLDRQAQRAVIRQKGFALDLGAVGKGAACDQALRTYEKLGVHAGIIAVGGSVALYGQKPGGGDWRIAVRNPLGEGALGRLDLASGFVSTSGSYEKYFEYEGKRYFHLLDPKTGYPAQSELISVTVVCDNGALSDALSTACFVLGEDKSLPLLKEFEAEAVFVLGDKRVTVTQGLKDRFTLTAEGFTNHE